MKPLLIILLGYFILSSPALCQVGINPPAVFIDPATGSGMVTIINKGSQTQEIELGFRFAYQAYDSSGRKYLVYDDSSACRKHSLMPYIMAYPRKFKLPPASESVARFLITGADSLPDGAYWSRLIIKSRQSSRSPDTSVSVDGSLRPGFDIITELVGIIIYPKGSIIANLDLRGAEACHDSSRLYIDIDMVPSGNSPFWGNIALVILDESGNLVASARDLLSVYSDSRLRFSFDLSIFLPGKSYSALASVDNSHKDLPPWLMIGSSSFTKTFIFPVK